MAVELRFLSGAVKWLAAAGVALVLWMLADSMTPAADARAPLVVDLSTIAPGERRTVRLRQTLIAILHRTPEQIAAARADDDAAMPSPQPDAQRVQRPEWLVVEARPENSYFREEFGGVMAAGKYGGWFADYGDQHYDLSGRLREGRRATRNLPVPGYYFLGDSIIVVEQ